MKKYICSGQALNCDGCAIKGMGGCRLIEPDNRDEPEEEDEVVSFASESLFTTPGEGIFF